MLVIMNGYVDCVYLLLEKGFIVDVVDFWGCIVFYCGVVIGCEDCLVVLLDYDVFVLC